MTENKFGDLGTPEYQSEPSPLDVIIGRAALDPAYRVLLLASPARTLMTEHLPLPLKAGLIALRARSLPEFAVGAAELEKELNNKPNLKSSEARKLGKDIARMFPNND